MNLEDNTYLTLNHKLSSHNFERLRKVSNENRTGMYLILFSAVMDAVHFCCNCRQANIELPNTSDSRNCCINIPQCMPNGECTYKQYLKSIKDCISNSVGGNASNTDGKNNINCLVTCLTNKEPDRSIAYDLIFEFAISVRGVICLIKYNPNKIIRQNLLDLNIHWDEFMTLSLSSPDMELSKIHAQVCENMKQIKNSKKAEISQDNLVLIKKTNGTDGNIFFVHDGSGEADSYFELVNHLEGDFNFWGIAADRTGAKGYLNSMLTEIAKQYVKQIQSIQPVGPYILAGWSIGGTIVYEMSRILETQGQSVRLTVLIDSLSPSQRNDYLHEVLVTEKEEMIKVLDNESYRKKIKNVCRLHEIFDIMLDYARHSEKNSHAIKKYILHEYEDIIPAYARDTTENIMYYYNRICTLNQARLLYIPQGKISSPVHFFKAEESEMLNEQGWQRHCSSDIHFYELQGSHHTILKNPNVLAFAEILNKLIKNG